MKYFSSLITAIVITLMFTGSPVRADDNPFINLISGSKIYFSHIATAGGWQTEIAVLNPTSGPAAATLTSYNAGGVPIGSAVSINLPAHGRYQAAVGGTFADSANIAYMVLTSKVFGLKGYSKFYTGAVRASIIASTPKNDGMFTKIDHAGWTGIVFINTSAVTANITLTAYNNFGVAVATETMPVPAGNKVVNMAEKIFAQSIAGATYVSYHSDKGVVGFFLNGSNDGLMLDGSQAL